MLICSRPALGSGSGGFSVEFLRTTPEGVSTMYNLGVFAGPMMRPGSVRVWVCTHTASSGGKVSR